MLVEEGPEVARGGTTICQGCLDFRLHPSSISIIEAVEAGKREQGGREAI